MLFLWLSTVMLSIAYILAAIPSKFEDIHRRSVHHTCESNDECEARLNSSWLPYTFVCCTTIICDENYGNYYLVKSGCTTQRQCTSIIQMKGYSCFAARFERHIFESFDSSLVGNCALTRQKMQYNAVPDATFVSEEPEPTTTIPPSTRTTESPQCPCTDPAECCLQVICADSLQKEAQEFRTQVECVPQCVHLVIKAAHQYTFYMPLNTWSRRTEYEREQGAPAVEGTCRETRYFFYWVMKDMKQQ